MGEEEERERRDHPSLTSFVSSKSHLFPAIANTILAGPNLLSILVRLQTFLHL